MRSKVALVALLIAAVSVLAPMGTAGAAPPRSIPVSAAVVGYDFYDAPNGEILGLPPWARFTYDTYTVVLRDVVAHALWQGSEYLQGGEWSTVSINAHIFCEPTACDVPGGRVTGKSRFTLDSIAGGWNGTLTGRVTAYVYGVGFRYEGTYVAAGWGELTGWELRMTFTNDTTSGLIAMTGYAIPPLRT